MVGIPVEFYKYSSGVLENLLVVLFMWFFENGGYPDEWCEGIINPINNNKFSIWLWTPAKYMLRIPFSQGF